MIWCYISGQWKIDPRSHTLIHQMRRDRDECLARCNRRLLWCFHHTCCSEGCCVCALCSGLEKSMGVYRERWEIHRGGVTQQILLFHVFSSRQPVLVETNHCVSFSFPDLCAVPVSLQGSSSLDQTFCFSFFRTDQVDVRLIRWTNSHLQNDVAFPNGLLVWCQTNWIRLWLYLMFSYWQLDTFAMNQFRFWFAMENILICCIAGCFIFSLLGIRVAH